LKSSSSTVPAIQPVEGSVEELHSKIIGYQKFITEYIVKAQEEKYKAVKTAEKAISEKYEAKMSAFMLEAATTSTSKASAVTTKSADEPELYKKRNNKITAAAESGKSRWDAKEVKKVSSLPKDVSESAQVNVNGASEIADMPIPPEVIAADHGLRADGGVGGLTLAERVAQGADASATYSAVLNNDDVDSSSANASVPIPSVDARNSMVAAAAKAGKQSRWGAMEENKAINDSKLLKS